MSPASKQASQQAILISLFYPLYLCLKPLSSILYLLSPVSYLHPLLRRCSALRCSLHRFLSRTPASQYIGVYSTIRYLHRVHRLYRLCRLNRLYRLNRRYRLKHLYHLYHPPTYLTYLTNLPTSPTYQHGGGRPARSGEWREEKISENNSGRASIRIRIRIIVIAQCRFPLDEGGTWYLDSRGEMR